VRSTVEGLERGVAGTKATIEKMHKLVALGKLDPTLQKIATWIRASVLGDRRGSTKATADAVFNWCAKHGIFKRDAFQVEVIEHPIEAMRPIIQAKQAGVYKGPGLFTGDCDTYAIMTATLGGILGFQYAFETAKVDASRPDEFSHIWTALLIDNEWYPLDSSTGGAYPGWRPPVAAKLFARWPEKPIESVVGSSDMHSINGGMLGEFGEDLEPDSSDDRNGRSPLADVDAEYPKDYISYGIPRDFGAGPGVVPPGNFEDLQLLPPHDTQIPDADLQSDMHVLKAAPRLDPSERIQSIDGQPNDHGNPYYRTNGGPTPYFKIERQFYPPGSRWNGQMGHDSVRYVKTGAYVQVKSPETPERQVRVTMDQPMLTRRRTVLVAPRRVPFGAMEGYGMGDEDMPDPVQPDSGSWTDSFVGPTQPTVQDTSVVSSLPGYNPNAPAGSTGSIAVRPTPVAPKTPATQQAAAAGSSVWDALSSVFKGAGSVVPAVMQTRAAQAVINATNKLAGRPVVGAGVTAPWYKNPFVLGAGVLVLGGGAYIAMKTRPGSGGRRRRGR
jgi:hypothetical protein